MKKITKIVAALLVAVMVVSIMPAKAEAASTRKVTAGVSEAKAGVVKVGSNAVTATKAKNGTTFVKFTAPSTAKYTFVMSDIVSKNKKNSTGLGNWYLLKKNGSYYQRMKVSTEGGKTDWLKMASKNYNDKYLKSPSDKMYYRKTRSAKKVSLKKGQTIWMRFYFTANQCTYKMTIKKVK